MKSKPSLSLYLDKRVIINKTDFPVKIRITYNRISRLYSIGINMSTDDFEKLFSNKVKDKKLLEKRGVCQKELKKAENIADLMEDFNFPEFKNLFFGTMPEPDQNNSVISKDLAWFYYNYISELKLSGRVSSYQSMNNSLQSLTKFKENISFNDLTPRFLENYEKWMLENGNSITSVGIYLRNLRVILNLAIEAGVYPVTSYPFGKRKFIIPTGRNIKKALSKSELKLIFEYKPLKGSQMDKARDFWIFSYLCIGLNLADIARIKLKDISEDKITLIRTKTKGSKRGNAKSLEIFILPQAKEIINKWGIPYGSKEDYLFDILKIDYTPEQIRGALQNFNKLTNKYMAKLGNDLGISKSLNFYSARHTAASNLLKSGVPIEFISNGLAHSDIRVTQSYLSSFEDEKVKEFSHFLTDL